MQLASQALLVAVNLKRLTGNDLDLVIFFVLLRWQANDLTSETRIGFRVGATSSSLAALATLHSVLNESVRAALITSGFMLLPFSNLNIRIRKHIADAPG